MAYMSGCGKKISEHGLANRNDKGQYLIEFNTNWRWKIHYIRTINEKYKHGRNQEIQKPNIELRHTQE